jgi:hypothetical protein
MRRHPKHPVREDPAVTVAIGRSLAAVHRTEKVAKPKTDEVTTQLRELSESNHFLEMFDALLRHT